MILGSFEPTARRDEITGPKAACFMPLIKFLWSLWWESLYEPPLFRQSLKRHFPSRPLALRSLLLWPRWGYDVCRLQFILFGILVIMCTLLISLCLFLTLRNTFRMRDAWKITRRRRLLSEHLTVFTLVTGQVVLMEFSTRECKTNKCLFRWSFPLLASIS